MSNFLKSTPSSAVMKDNSNGLVPEVLMHEFRKHALDLINRLGGPQKALVLIVLLMSSIVFVRFYRKYIQIPPHLEGLPKVPFIFSIRIMFIKPPLIEKVNEEYELVVKDALRRGQIKSENEHPPMWAKWEDGHWGLVLANPTDIKDLFANPEKFEKYDFESLNLYGIKKFMGSNLALVRTPQWKHQRKIINPAFRRGWATSLFVEPTSQLIGHFDKMAASGELLDTSKWMSCMALDALSSVIFGKSFGSINDPNSDIVRIYNSVMSNFQDPVVNLFGGNIMKFSSKVKKFDHDVELFNTFVDKWIDEKTRIINSRGRSDDTDGNDSTDLLEMMVTAQLRDSEFTKEDLRSNCATFFLAGHDTTATTLTMVMYLLGLNQGIQEKVRQEVIKIMGDADPSLSHEKFVFATNEQQNSMRYLTCVIKETLRLFPPVSIATREIMEEHVLPSSGLRIPPSSLVRPNLRHLQHDKENWGRNAEEFEPERWESLHPDSKSIPLNPGAHDFTWAPFGGGQRSCIGQQFSIVEQRVVLSSLLLRYTWEVVGDEAALKGYPATAPGSILHGLNILIRLTRRI